MTAPQNISRFRQVFKNKHVVLPVIHVKSEEQAHRNTEIAKQAGADGVFLINHSIGAEDLLSIQDAVVKSFPGYWIGVNCLGWPVGRIILQAGNTVAGVWSDNAMIEERDDKQVLADQNLEVIQSTRWAGLYFGGVAFKYQRHVDDLVAAASIARRYMDVVTTSGPGTGHAAHVEKIATMKSALGDFPLAIASGITPENVADYMPHSDCYLVATGISQSFHMLDPERAKELVQRVREGDG